MNNYAKGITATYGVGWLVLVFVFQRDVNHFTNWSLFVQSAFYCLVIFDSLRPLMVRFLLPVVFANTLAVFVGSYAILHSGSTLYHAYIDEYGEVKVTFGNVGLHLIPFLVTVIYTRIYRKEIRMSLIYFTRHMTPLFDYVVCVVGSTFIMPLGYRLFYNPVVEYGSSHDNVWITTILLAAYVFALSVWFFALFPISQATNLSVRPSSQDKHQHCDDCRQ
jgi:hypothetical protein